VRHRAWRWAAIALLSIGTNFLDAQDVRQAVELHRRNDSHARQALERVLLLVRKGTNPSDLALVLQHLSEIDLAQASYPQAIARSMECADTRRATHDAVGEIDCRTITGRAQTASGRYAEASATYTNALRVAQAHQLAEARIALLNNAGNISYFLGRYDAAFRSYTEAETLLPAYSREPWFERRQTVTLANLAALYQRLGQYEKALRIYNRISSRAQLSRGDEQGQILENMGTLFRRLGDPYRAVELYGQAGTLFQAAHDTAGEISAAKNTGIALAFGLNQGEKAAPLFRRAFDLASRSQNGREVAQSALYQGETMRRSGDSVGANSMFRQALQASQKIGSLEDEWKAQFGLAQLAEAAGDADAALALYRQAIELIEKIRSSAGPPAMRTGFLSDKRDVYDGAIGILLKQQPPPVPSIFQLLEKAKTRSFQDALPTAGRALDLQTIARSLPPDAMLLNYWLSGDRLAVVWVDHGVWGLAQSTAPANALLLQFRDTVQSGTGGEWRQLAAELSNAILPIANPRTKRLIVIPDGALQSIPFELLSFPHSAGRLLIEDHSLSYLPSAALLFASSTPQPDWMLPWQTSFEGFANPQPAAAGSANSMYPTDPRDLLTYSKLEVLSAARLAGGHANLHVGMENLKSAILALPPRALPVLHLATHAVADSDDPDRSRILFSPAISGGPSEYLFAREIYGMNLRRVGLVILSACDTERGTSVRGEGVQSFSRALLAAGARSTITTLWRVGDLTGKAFSDRFYTHYARGEAVEDALRSAKLDFYRSHGPLAHPSYWSLYVLNGDPGIKLPRTLPWSGLLAAVLLLAAAWFFSDPRRRRKRSRSLDPH
jgi:CHAT domain-containing protein